MQALSSKMSRKATEKKGYTALLAKSIEREEADTVFGAKDVLSGTIITAVYLGSVWAREIWYSFGLL